RLVAGQVDWLTEPLAFINEGEILPLLLRAKWVFLYFFFFFTLSHNRLEKVKV
ncbi:hypothetical protein ACVGWF_08645, partial [Enterobacter asburiae]